MSFLRLSGCLALSIFTQPLAAQNLEFETRPEDEIVLLKPKASLGIQNFADRKSPKGYCFGINHLQWTLWSSVSFTDSPRDSDTAITEKLLKAAKDGVPTVIGGFHDLSDFLKRMTQSSAVHSAISDLQYSHSLQFENQGKLNYQWSNAVHQEATNSRFSISEIIGDPVLQAEDIKKSIDAKIPLSITVAGRTRKNTSEIHSVTILGYIKNPSENPPTRFLISDPNHPDDIRIMQLKKDSVGKIGWSYTLPNSKEPSFVTTGIHYPSQLQKEQLVSRFDFRSRSEREVCQTPKSSLRQIFKN